MPDRTPLTLGESLAAPMERANPESNPSVMPWEVTQYRLKYERSPLFAYGLVTHMPEDGTTSGSLAWQVHCSGPTVSFRGSFETAEDARAAVEEHILAHVDTGLSEEPE